MADQTNQIQLFAAGLFEDHTPGSDVTAGTPLNIGGRAAVAANDIAANILGAIQVSGLFKVVQKAELIPLGSQVWFDNTGDPVGGTAGTGAATATTLAAAAGFYLGTARLASASSDAQVIVDLNGKTQFASIVAAAGTDKILIDEIVSALRGNGIIAGV